MSGLHVAAQAFPADGPGVVPYTADLVNTSADTLTGLASPVQSVVSRDGVVVASFVGGRMVGRSIDLAPGDSKGFEGSLSLLDCTAPDTTGGLATKASVAIPRVSLPPGTYTVRSWLDVVRPGGSTAVIRSDPWEVQLG